MSNIILVTYNINTTKKNTEALPDTSKEDGPEVYTKRKLTT
jgi:hypothetical protein